MTDNKNQNPNPPESLPSSSSSSSSKPRVSDEIDYNNGSKGRKVHYRNPPEATNPDPATLREQWRFAVRQYSRWYSHAWGTAILAGLSFFALGWIVKGSNPLPSYGKEGKPSQLHQKKKRQQHDDDQDIPSPSVPPPLTSSPSAARRIPKS